MAGDAAMAEIVNVIGADAATALTTHFGGTEVYVPRVIDDDHRLVAAIGRIAAEALVTWAGGAALAVPKQVARRSRVRELRKNSRLTIAEIAVQTAFSERQVYRLLKEQADDRQPSLFDGIE